MVETILIVEDNEFNMKLFNNLLVGHLVAASPFKVAAVEAAIEVTISVGLAVSRGATDTTESMVERADQTLCRAKHAGRNRIEIS